MPIDSQVQAIIDMMTQAGLPQLNMLPPVQARMLTGEMAKNSPPGPALWKVEDIHIPGPDISARIYRPDEMAQGLVVYFHGGGWVLGDLQSCDGLCRTLAKKENMAVLSVNYRLAPEHPFPAAADDAFFALKYAAENLKQLAGWNAPLIVAGDSAGANLAIVAAIDARDSGGPEIAFQLLFYPVTDSNFNTESYMQLAEAPILTRSMMQWFWDHYAPGEADRVHPRAAPMRAKDLSGLPPALIQTAEYDPLRDEGEAFGARLKQAGVNVIVQRRAGLVHGYTGMSAIVDAAAAAVDDAVGALKTVAKPFQ